MVKIQRERAKGALEYIAQYYGYNEVVSEQLAERTLVAFEETISEKP